MTNPFEAYQTYLALKQHFTRDGYDYFRYGGKVIARLSSFESRKDKYFFYKLAKHKDLEHFLLANFVDKDVSWVRDLLGTEADQIYNEWLRRQQSLSYIFKNDLDKMGDDLNENLKVYNGHHPPLLNLYMAHDICLESLIIMNDILRFFKLWNAKIEEDIIWPDIYRKCTKYKPFLRYDHAQFKKMLRERFT